MKAVVAEAEAALKALKKEVARRELEALLGGEADRFDSYLEVHAGAGGTESQDWASMLLRMYTRWAEKHGFKIGISGRDARRRSRHQIRHHPDQRTQRLWLAEDRSGCAPAGADIAVRFQCAPAHFVFQALRFSLSSTTASRSTSRNPTCAPTPCARAAPAVSTSTRPNPPCGSPTFRPALRWSARPAVRNTRTRRRRGT